MANKQLLNDLLVSLKYFCGSKSSPFSRKQFGYNFFLVQSYNHLICNSYLVDQCLKHEVTLLQYLELELSQNELSTIKCLKKIFQITKKKMITLSSF